MNTHAQRDCPTLNKLVPQSVKAAPVEEEVVKKKKKSVKKKKLAPAAAAAEVRQ